MELTEFEVSLKRKDSTKISRQKVLNSDDTAEIVREIFDSDVLEWREEMIMLLFNRSNELIGYYKVSSGGMAGTVCDPKVVFTIALNGCAHSIILAHNHPSGNCKPSKADIEFTQKIKQGGEFLDVKLLDSIIVTTDSHYSMTDYGDI